MINRRSVSGSWDKVDSQRLSFTDKATTTNRRSIHAGYISSVDTHQRLGGSNNRLQRSNKRKLVTSDEATLLEALQRLKICVSSFGQRREEMAQSKPRSSPPHTQS